MYSFSILCILASPSHVPEQDHTVRTGDTSEGQIVGHQTKVVVKVYTLGRTRPRGHATVHQTHHWHILPSVSLHLPLNMIRTIVRSEACWVRHWEMQIHGYFQVYHQDQSLFHYLSLKLVFLYSECVDVFSRLSELVCTGGTSMSDGRQDWSVNCFIVFSFTLEP